MVLHRFLLSRFTTRSSTRVGMAASRTVCRPVTVDISKSLASNYSHTTSKTQKRKEKRQKERRDSGRASYRFVDRTRVQVSGGEGGNGSLSMDRMGRKHHRRPDGGHGGQGGSIVIVADAKEQSLRWTHPHVVAEGGTHGTSKNMHGRKGKNTVLRVPCGVVIRRILDFDEEWDEETKTVRKLHQKLPNDQNGFGEDGLASNTLRYSATKDPPPPKQATGQPYLASLDYDSDEASDDESDDSVTDDVYDSYLNDEPSVSFTAWGDREKVLVADLDQPGSYAVVARGGIGGVGSAIFKSTNGPIPGMEEISANGKPELGDTAYLELELKLIADIGLVGFPNAGKSSLLAAMSRATPHIAPYPFTTLNPLVGYIEYRDGFRVCAADIPGLISGASIGRGRGHDFLRHLERTKALLYIVDAAGVDGRNPVEDLQILVDELAAYGDGRMLERNALVVANKIDLLDEDTCRGIMTDLNQVVEDAGIQMSGDILGISAGVSGDGLSSLSKAIREIVTMSTHENDLRTA